MLRSSIHCTHRHATTRLSNLAPVCQRLLPFKQVPPGFCSSRHLKKRIALLLKSTVKRAIGYTRRLPGLKVWIQAPKVVESTLTKTGFT